jgi:hypothetical protein
MYRYAKKIWIKVNICQTPKLLVKGNRISYFNLSIQYTIQYMKKDSKQACSG